MRGYHDGMESSDREHASSVPELRELAQAAGIGSIAPPAPVRLDDLRREITESQARVARLLRVLEAKAS